MRTKILATATVLVIGGVLLSFYGPFAFLALPAPLLFVIVALWVFGGKHTGSVILGGLLAWILCIQVVRAGDVGSHGNPGGLFEAVLFGVLSLAS